LDWKSKTKNILFLSVDIVGSTQYKQYYSERGESQHWIEFFEFFFEEFPKQLNLSIQKSSSHYATDIEIWKTLGDEIIFKANIKNYRQVEIIIDYFINTIYTFRQIIKQKGLDSDISIDIKGSSWISEFPVYNSTLTIGKAADYIGPSIDIGFRISKFATRRKFVISIEVARILVEKTNGFKLYFDDTIPLKGVFKEKPYPLIWIDTQQNSTTDIEARLRKKVDENDLKLYCDSLFNNEAYPIHFPFFPEGEDFIIPPEGYLKELERQNIFNEQKDIAPENGIDDAVQPSAGKSAELLLKFEKTLATPKTH